LQARGWRVQPQADWIATLGLLDEDRDVALQPVLPATLDAEAETLLLRRPGAHAGEILVLRLWHAPALLDDGMPLWLGSTQTLHYTRPFDAFGLWQPQADDGGAHAALRDALDGFALHETPHPAAGVAVLRIRSDGDR
jgi:hypothetical protein